jgi:hypothetical protein
MKKVQNIVFKIIRCQLEKEIMGLEAVFCILEAKAAIQFQFFSDN